MALTGAGLSKVLLLSADTKESTHWMVDRLLRRAGLGREQFYFATAENGWLADSINAGVKAVVALGEEPLRYATRQYEIARWRGRVVENPDLPWLTVPTFKPSKLLPFRAIPGAPPDPEMMRNPSRYQGRWIRDVHYALHVAVNGFKRRPTRYLLDPSPEVFLKWAEGYKRDLDKEGLLKLSVDIETPYKAKKDREDELEESEQSSDLNTTIIRIGFSYRETEGVSIPFSGPYLAAVRMLLAEPADKVWWNGITFDKPVLQAQDFIINGLTYDGMDAFKFLFPDLDRGLEAVSADATDLLPWKHLSDAMPAHYNAVDVDAALRNMNWIEQRLRAQGAWESYQQGALFLMPDLKEAGDRGNTIDLGYQAELLAEMNTEQSTLETQIQKVVPEHLKPRKRYKRIPDVEVKQGWTDSRFETVDGRVFEPVDVITEQKVCSRCGEVGVTKGDHTAKKSLGKTLVEERHHPKKCTFPDLFGAECSCPKGWPKRKWEVTPNPCHGAEIVLRPEPAIEWDEILPFSVSSADQLKAYMKAHKHPVGESHKTEDGESADAKHLGFLEKKYGHKHPLYGLALKKKKVDKAKSTYVWIPDTNGKIHQTYVNSPSTLRLGGRAYNLMNVGKRYDPKDPESGNYWAWRARNQIVASPGNVLVQADSSAIEAVMQGWYMGDTHYMWLANQSIHAWLATKQLGWEFNPDTVKKVKKDHKNLYDSMKVMNYTTNFGGSPFGAHKANPDVFPTVKDAERTQNMLFELLPSLEAYQYHVRYLAHKQGYLESPWKIRLEFYDVFTLKKDRFGNQEFTPSGRPKLKLGKDGKRAVAFFPQHSNAMFLRYNARHIFDSKWRQYVPANFLVHDGYTLDVPVRLAEEAAEFLLELLTRPIAEMGNLRVGAEAEIGYNWGSHDDVHNPRGMKGYRKVVIEKQELTWMPKPTGTEIKAA
jgi:hypothetical protein